MTLTLKPRVLAITAALLAAPATASADQVINCPLSQIRGEVTTSIAPGWWNTPQVSSLQNTRVVAIGGRPALMCEYGAAGNIQRYAPSEHTCTAQPGGFHCVSAVAPPAPPTANVRASGNHFFRNPGSFDLDSGRITRGAGDLRFSAQGRRTAHLVATGGASYSLGGASPRGKSGCEAAAYSNGQIALGMDLIGTHVCIRTNEGRYSEIVIGRMRESGQDEVIRLPIQYTTWE